MASFNSSTNVTLTLGPNDTLQVAGLALLRVSPSGGTPFETTNIGEVQTYGPYRAPTTIQLLGEGYGTYTGGTVAPVKDFMPLAIFGRPNVGQTLTVAASVGWQNNGGNWTRDGLPINGANGLTYTLLDADFSHAVTYVSSNIQYIPPVLIIGVSLQSFSPAPAPSPSPPAPSPAPSPAATAITLTGPTSGTVSVASSSFTVGANGTLSGNVVVTLASSNGGTFSPSTVTLNSGTPTGTFTFMPANTGAATITAANSGSLTNPSSITYTASAPAADTRPRFGYAPANSTGDQTAFGNLFGTMTPMTGSSSGGRSGTFNTVSSTTNYTWLAVLHSAAPNGIRIFDGTGYGGFSGSQSTGIYQGADTDPLTVHGTFTNTDGNVYDMYRGNGKASTYSTFTLQ